ncbi:MAG: chloramphenicol phosphotransferase [Gammaproteobacteria bacterium]|nr:chloramphenicol phosphotransferase [Gammaproteobacteria bacterium]
MMIILLNGATSSGKTNIAKAIQHLDTKPWLTLGIDTLINMMPTKYWAGGEKADEGYNFIAGTDEDGLIMSLKIGPYGQKIDKAIVKVAELLSSQEFNIIIDEVLMGDESLKNYVQTLSQYPVYFIGVHCGKTILEEREILRGDRFVGSARDQMKRCHGPTRCYDVEVDTTHHSSFECAKQILDFVSANPSPRGFETLRMQFI